MVRMATPYAHIVACLGGCGKVLIDGKMVNWPAGKVLLCPTGGMHAFEAVNDEPWQIAWVFYDDRIGQKLVDGTVSRLVDGEASSFVSTIQMLAREAYTEEEPAVIQSLVSLLEIYTLRLGDGRRVDDRLARLWETVEADLGRDWSMAMLAKEAAMSQEHLRRLCQRDYGNSPMRRLSELRMHRACFKLRESSCKIETIATQLGFSSVYAFSAAFRKAHGIPPGRFRSSSNL
jgi:AraC-like DNA-binding protein